MAEKEGTQQEKEKPTGAARVYETPEGAIPAESAAPVTTGADSTPARKEKPAAEKPLRGSWVRPIVRIFVFMAILLFLGALAVFLLLFTPSDQQLRALQAQATQTAGQLEQSQSELQTVREDLEAARGDVEAARQQAEAAQQAMEVEMARSEVLRAINDLTFARMALQEEDKAGVTESLNASEARLTEILPLVEARDPEQASTLTALYTLAKNDLERDLSLVGQDLDRLQTELERVEANVLTRD